MVEPSTSGRKAGASSKWLGYTNIFGQNSLANALAHEERLFEFSRRIEPDRSILREAVQDIFDNVFDNVFDPRLSSNPKILREDAFQRMVEHETFEGFTFWL